MKKVGPVITFSDSNKERYVLKGPVDIKDGALIFAYQQDMMYVLRMINEIKAKYLYTPFTEQIKLAMQEDMQHALGSLGIYGVKLSVENKILRPGNSTTIINIDDEGNEYHQFYAETDVLDLASLNVIFKKDKVDD